MKERLSMFTLGIIMLSMVEVIVSDVTKLKDIPDVSINPGTLYSYDVTINDFESDYGVDNLEYSLTSKPSWMDGIRRRFEELGYLKPYGFGGYDIHVTPDNYAYYAEYNGGFKILDVSNKTNPVVLSKKGEGSIEYVALDVSDNLLFLATFSGTLEIYTLTSPTILKLVKTVATPLTIVTKVRVDKKREVVYVLGQGGMYIVDISIIGESKVINHGDTLGPIAQDIDFDDKEDIYVVSTGGALGINAYHYTKSINLLLPFMNKTISPEPYGIRIRDEKYYIAASNCIHVYTWMAFLFIEVGTKCESFGPYSRIELYGEKYVVINAQKGLYLLDVSNYGDIKVDEIRLSTTSGYTQGLQVVGNVAYAPYAKSFSTFQNPDGLFIMGLNGITLQGTPSESDCTTNQAGGINSVSATVRVSDSSQKPYDDTFSITVPCSTDSESKSGETFRSQYTRAVSGVIATLFVLLCCGGCLCGVLLCCLMFGISLLLILCGGSITGSIGLNLLQRKVGKGKGGGVPEDQVEKIMKESLLGETKSAAAIKVNEALFEIKYDDIEVIRMIGQGGSNSVVFYGKWKSKEIAFKCFKTSDLFSESDNFTEFEREVSVMSSLRHPYCLYFYGCCLYPPRVGIIMEYCSNGDLKSFLTSTVDYPISDRLRVLYQVCDGMEYLHERNVIHRDLKSENILLDKNHDAKIMDFGVSRVYQRINVEKTKNVGTSFYIAPEVVQGGDYSEKCDVFSFSIVLWEVLTGNFKPYGANSLTNVEYKVSSDENYRPDVNKIGVAIRRKYKSVIQSMMLSWKRDPVRRPSFKDLKEMFHNNIHNPAPEAVDRPSPKRSAVPPPRLPGVPRRSGPSRNTRTAPRRSGPPKRPPTAPRTVHRRNAVPPPRPPTAPRTSHGRNPPAIPRRNF